MLALKVGGPVTYAAERPVAVTRPGRLLSADLDQSMRPHPSHEAPGREATHPTQ